MSRLSRWMVGYGALLIACDAIESLSRLRLGMHGRTMVFGWTGGALMVAAGLAVIQGRRSLRVGGLFLGLLLPLFMAGMLALQSADTWRQVRAGSAEILEGALCSTLALLSVIAIWVFNRVRPREGIATRGYAIPIPPVTPNPTPATTPAKPAHRHSEAG